MKELTLGLLLLAVACGKSELAGVNSDSEFTSTIQSVSDDTKSDLASICQVLRDKELVMRNNYLGNGTKFKFTTTQKFCSSSPQSSQVVTRLGFANGYLVYELVSGSYFLSQLETGNAGTMSALCNNLAGLTQPLVLANDFGVRFAVTKGSKCSSDANHRCVTMETGLKQENGAYLIKYSDSFQIDLNAGPLSGMVLKHEHKSFDACPAGSQLTNVATFVGTSL